MSAKIKEVVFSVVNSTESNYIIMRKELAIDSIIEDYLEGRLNADEALAFEALRKSDAAIDQKVIEHTLFLSSIKNYRDNAILRDKLNAIHDEVDVNGLVEVYRPKPGRIVKLWRRNRSAVAVAASFIVVLSVALFSIQSNKTQTGTYAEMKNELSKIRTSQNNLIRNLQSNKPAAVNPGKFGGSGFALSANGYICTNYHVVKDADSIYVQNSKGESFKVVNVYNDPQYDLAILKIVDSKFTNLPQLPYSLKTATIGLGENVYTLGYPKNDAVLGEGYVSSKSGFGGDTTMAYQVAIPVNPGNSGGPLLNNQGHIIGVISGKENQTDGAAFAVKSKFIKEALNAIPQDSLTNRISSSKKTLISGMKRTKQIEKIQDYVFMVRVF